ncbi:MAG: helix-hairpin-helix domain-containing protein [Pyrinomonadaceae bacterium]|nr:helix-hairpin-helix domain-containing protein [Pyrinomonadaceae bacterium]
MKQSLATSKVLTLLIAVSFAFIFWFPACSRLPRSHTSETISVKTPASVTNLAPINLNTASAADLQRLPGVGPVLAERIINYRDENGRFRRAEHLMMVRGISDRKFRELRSLVRVE